MSNPDQPSFSIAGTGRLARALAFALTDTGWRLDALIGRSPEKDAALADRLGARALSLGEPSCMDSDLDCDVVLIAVADHALEEVAIQLNQFRTDWTDVFVFHTSGAFSSRALAPLSENGALTASVHPMQTFTATEAVSDSLQLFSGVPMAVEGNPGAVACAFRMAKDLGCVPFVITEASKSLYHAAASMASNALVTLIGLSSEMLQECGIPKKDSPGVLMSLVERTVHNVFDIGVEEALTGPIVRGDADVINCHLHAIRQATPHLIPVYSAIATETVRIATDSERLTSAQAETILDILERETKSYALERERPSG